MGNKGSKRNADSTDADANAVIELAPGGDQAPHDLEQSDGQPEVNGAEVEIMIHSPDAPPQVNGFVHEYPDAPPPQMNGFLEVPSSPTEQESPPPDGPFASPVAMGLQTPVPQSLSRTTHRRGKSGMYSDLPPPSPQLAGAALGATQIRVDRKLLTWLRKVPLLAKLTPTELQTLAGSLTERTFRNGYRIIVEGDVGQECFILAKGSARVTKWHPEARTDAELCVLSTGDFVGEGVLLTEGVSQRGATVTAVGQCHCYLLAREHFRALLGQERLNVQFKKRAAISDNSALPVTSSSAPRSRKGDLPAVPAAASSNTAPSDAFREKNPQTTAMLLKVVMESVLFANIDEAQRRTIVDTMWLRQVRPHEIIITQGDIGEHWYVIDSGSFDILVSPKTGGPQAKVADKQRGAGVGELALLYNAPRAATVRASRPGAVWVLDRYTYRTILTTAAEDKRVKFESFLKGVKAFDVLIDSERSKLAEALEEVVFEENTPIVNEGEMGDTFYIILHGLVVVSKEKEGELIRLRAGDYFGEKAVIMNEPRAATCMAATRVTCVYLKSEAFKDLLGSMDDIFRSRQEMYNNILENTRGKGKKGASDAAKNTAATAAAEATAKQNSLKGAKDPNSPTAKPENNTLLTHLKLQDLKVIGTLGKGSFGTVQLVKDRTGATYALKIVSKQSVVELGQQQHIVDEKRTMVQLNHPFLVRLFATFKDADRLYFLLEASLGGELFTVLRSKSTFPETTARFYAASIVLAFEYMHARGIVYRDLKPENLLLDSKGYLKVTDFGFAKKIGEGRTWTLCGTPDYLAPEVVSGQGHGKAVDWWTLGILIFEMIAGYPPFYDEDPMKTYSRIMSGAFTFPMHFSKQAMDLIRKLLNPKAGKRYGSLAGGATLIKNHPWFSKFDWGAFLARRLPAPIVLPVKSPEDLSNFDRGQEKAVQVLKYKPAPGAEPWEKDF